MNPSFSRDKNVTPDADNTVATDDENVDGNDDGTNVAPDTIATDGTDAGTDAGSDAATNDARTEPIDLSTYITGRSSQRYVDSHVRKTYYLRPHLYKRLTRLSERMNVPMSEIVNDALTLFFAHLDEATKGTKKGEKK